MSTSIGMMDPAYFVGETSYRATSMLFYVLSCPVLICSVVSCAVLCCAIQSCPVPPCPVSSCPVLSCAVMSLRVLSCVVLSCPVLSCVFAVLYCAVARAKQCGRINTNAKICKASRSDLSCCHDNPLPWAGRKEILDWLNGYLGLNISKVSSSPWLRK